MGLECMGDLDLYQISEVLMLAAKSLELLGGHILDLSHMGVLRGLLEALDLDPGSEKQLFSFLREKNCHGSISRMQIRAFGSFDGKDHCPGPLLWPNKRDVGNFAVCLHE